MFCAKLQGGVSVDNILHMFAQLAILLLGAVNLAMLVRAVTSWIPDLDGAWLDVVYMITELVVAPIRAIFELFPIFRNSPIDFSFLIAFLVLNIIQELLSGFTVMVLR